MAGVRASRTAAHPRDDQQQKPLAKRLERPYPPKHQYRISATLASRLRSYYQAVGQQLLKADLADLGFEGLFKPRSQVLNIAPKARRLEK